MSTNEEPTFRLERTKDGAVANIVRNGPNIELHVGCGFASAIVLVLT